VDIVNLIIFTLCQRFTVSTPEDGQLRPKHVVCICFHRECSIYEQSHQPTHLLLTTITHRHMFRRLMWPSPGALITASDPVTHSQLNTHPLGATGHHLTFSHTCMDTALFICNTRQQVSVRYRMIVTPHILTMSKLTTVGRF
jgi:hypothetical protein